MPEEQDRHPDEEAMELYALGGLPAEEIPQFEQHLLICPQCQDRMADVDADVQALQKEAREIRLRARSRKTLCERSSDA